VFRDAVFIARHQVATLDAALRMSPARRLAAVAVIGEQVYEKVRFDWTIGEFVER
jgi:hypothetical protein